MKKIKSILLIILFALTSCNNVKQFKLEEKYYNQGIIIEDDDCTLLNQAIDNKESFVLVVYSLLTCVNNFKDEIANSYFTSKKIDYYQVDYEKGKQLTNVISKTIKYTPSVLIFKKGKCVDYLKADDNDDIEAYNTLDGFAKWFESYVIIEK